MKHVNIPAPVAHAAHKLHSVVQRLEVSAHCAYLGMVSFHHADYYIAAAAMLVTTVAGLILHAVIALENPA